MSDANGAGTIRLSLREIRELPYRALRVAGLAHGEALEAAECVAFAELHHGDGLRQLAARCEAARADAAAPLAFERVDAGPDTSYRVEGAARLDPLRHATALVELATAPGRPCRVAAPPMACTSLVDLPLVLAAERTGRAVVAADGSRGSAIVRTATPDGALAAADAVTSAPTGPVAAALEAFAGERGFLVVVLADSSVRTGGACASSAESRRRVRAHAAEHGHAADAATWRRVLACAEAYKQPERTTGAAA